MRMQQRRSRRTARPDLEENAERWIRTAPESFCNTDDKKILSEVLNDYDQETTDFYRWHVTYTQEELKSLITERLKIESATFSTSCQWSVAAADASAA